ncbi:MAG TPA: SGNH hydrolase domain-containing protein [Acidimicrobiales bacterium]|nr:SGNH hydrolase domain-containing protein [Acidimicrobiales bacterium]
MKKPDISTLDPGTLRARAWRPARFLSAIVLAVVFVTSMVVVSVTTAGSLNAASSKTQLQVALKAGAKLKSLPSDTTPTLAQDVGVQELGGPQFPERCVAESQSQSTVPICPLGDTSSKKTMILLGDSQAHMWAPAFIAIARAQHERLIVLAKDACPPWLATYLTTGMSPFPQCTAFHKWALSEIQKLRPAQVYVTGAEGPLGVSSINLKPVSSLLKDIRKISPSTSVLSNIPWPTNDPVTCLSAHSSDISGCNMPEGEFKSLYGKFHTTLKEAAKSSGATFVNVDALFCTKFTCPVVVANHLVYYDDYHITWQYADYVATALDQMLSATFKA